MNEVWKDIENYEGIYQISNYGNVRSLDRLGYGGRKLYGNRISVYISDSGYPSVTLCKLAKHQKFYVHRLVANAFIPNPDNLPQVNHKDENKINNHVDNLEWCTHQYNNAYGTKGKRSSDYQRQFYQTEEGQKQKEKISKSLKQHFAKNGSHRKNKHMTVEQIERVRDGALRGWEKRRLEGTDKGYRLVNKDGKCIKIRCEDVQSYLDIGYKLGRT